MVSDEKYIKKKMFGNSYDIIIDGTTIKNNELNEIIKRYNKTKDIYLKNCTLERVKVNCLAEDVNLHLYNCYIQYLRIENTNFNNLRIESSFMRNVFIKDIKIDNFELIKPVNESECISFEGTFLRESSFKVTDKEIDKIEFEGCVMTEESKFYGHFNYVSFKHCTNHSFYMEDFESDILLIDYSNITVILL